ncbi:MAG TPA: alpha/beta hydrolase [Gammaproteobacteria bacterium]|nr:alpha/beta hydrolase [Gammaproteobacteria bacterium]
MREMINVRRLPSFVLLTVLASCAIGASPSADAQPKWRYRQMGSGRPVVVLESGLGERLDTWKSVQHEVSRFTETFSYNRAGYPGSPAAEGTRDAVAVVDELRELLKRRGLEPPYLLVGHSLGGLYVQYYARNFPDEVTGLVLVDSSHWAQSERIREAAPSTAGDATKPPRLPPGIVGEEAAAFDLTGHEVRDSPLLRPMPLIVLTAGKSGGPLWPELQRELAAQVPGARHTIAERSDHFIQERQPQFVWAAVRDIVIALRGQ